MEPFLCYQVQILVEGPFFFVDENCYHYQCLVIQGFSWGIWKLNFALDLTLSTYILK